MENIETLENLFKLWKDAHKNESETSCQNTFPFKKGNQPPDFAEFKGSFCPDGYISSKENYNGILIICRESNVSCNETMGEFKNCFAMKDSENDMAVYYKFIKKALKTLNELEADCNYTDENAKKCAYMNLNKRGGYGSTNSKRLANYVKAYEKFIKKEIELLKPDTIICGGTYGTVKKLGISKDITIYDCYHPACRRKFFKMIKQPNNQ